MVENYVVYRACCNLYVCFVIPGSFSFTIQWIRKQMSRVASMLRFFLSICEMYESKGESRARLGGECPDKTVRVLGNKRAMHLWDLNRLSGPFPRLCIIHRYLAVPWMFYALALFFFFSLILFFLPLVNVLFYPTKFQTHKLLASKGPCAKIATTKVQHALFVVWYSWSPVYYHFPYNRNLRE